MKKVLTILLTAAVIVGCIIAAGCTGTNTPADSEQAIPSEVAYTIYVSKESPTNFNVGDLAAIVLKTNPTTGYDWHMTQGEEVLYKSFSSAEQSSETPALVGAPSYKTFWLQAEKEGSYPITLEYYRSFDKANTTISVLNEVFNVVATDAPVADGPIATFIYDSFAINPPAGSYVKIVTTANPTTGYYFTPSGEGLTIIEDYTLDDESADGAMGVYSWYAKADTAGEYTFQATCKKAGSDDVVTSFNVPLKFT